MVLVTLIIPVNSSMDGPDVTYRAWFQAMPREGDFIRWGVEGLVPAGVFKIVGIQHRIERAGSVADAGILGLTKEQYWFADFTAKALVWIERVHSEVRETSGGQPQPQPQPQPQSLSPSVTSHLADRCRKLAESLKPLVKIADEYDLNGLDDEARKYWGAENEHQNTRDPSTIPLVEGRGGKLLLTLDDALKARAVMDETAKEDD